MAIDFELSRTLAYKTLLEQRQIRLKVDALSIVIPDKTIMFDTFQSYCQITGEALKELTRSNKIKFGLSISVDRNLYLILHNENIVLDECVNWTRMHEIGHIELNHSKDDAHEEIESNFYASCSLIPDAVIRKFLDYRLKVDDLFISNHFNVSSTAALKKIRTLRKYFPRHKYDADVVKLFEHDIEIIINDYCKSLI